MAATHLPGSPGLLIDEFDVLLFGPSSNDLPSYIIVSRQPKPRQFLVRLSSEHIEFRPIRELESTVAMLSAAKHRDGLNNP